MQKWLKAMKFNLLHQKITQSNFKAKNDQNLQH